jgi:hypothetical protein
LGNYYLKADTDSSINAVLGSYALSSSLGNYYLKADTDSSINAVLGSYSTKTYVDDRFTTLVGSISTDKLDTLAEIATALQGDASFGFNLYQRVESCDSSINTIRTTYATIASLSEYALTSSLSNYAVKSAVDSSLSSYALTSSLSSYAVKSVVDTSLSSYALTSSLSSYASLTTDISFAGNIQMGTSRSVSIGINKTPSTLYALDVSGPTFFSGNVSLNKRSTDISYAYFDMSAVTMNVYNMCEKFITMATLTGVIPSVCNYTLGSILQIYLTELASQTN